MLKPNVKQMLEIGKECGLDTIDEAYQNYMNHYDCFFSIEDFHSQLKEFTRQLTDLGFTEFIEIEEGTKFVLRELTIEHCLKMYDAWERAGA